MCQNNDYLLKNSRKTLSHKENSRFDLGNMISLVFYSKHSIIHMYVRDTRMYIHPLQPWTTLLSCAERLSAALGQLPELVECISEPVCWLAQRQACFMMLHVNAVIKRQAVGKMPASRQMAISRHAGDLLAILPAHVRQYCGVASRHGESSELKCR